MSSPTPPSALWSRGIQLIGFLAGLAGMGNEAFLVMEPRTILVAAYLAMMGIPAGLAADRRLRSPFGPSDPPPPAVGSNSSHDESRPS